MTRQRLKFYSICCMMFLVGAQIELWAQTLVKPGFNVFSVEQDVEIGRQSAAEAENQLPLLRDRSVESYVDRIGKRLAAVAPGAKYPYQFKVVNLSDVNAFALPGGFMYVNRGLIETAQTEGELAGVMAHEMAHVALRHGTNQASKAYLAQAGLGVLGGVLGDSATSQVIGMAGGFGLNALFLKFSRKAEEQADIVGTQMLAKAGYNPMEMVSMFETLRKQAGGDPGRFEEFFSSHPAPADRAERVRKEASLLGPVRATSNVGKFQQVKADLQRMPPAVSLQQVAQKRSSQDGGRPQNQGSVSPVQIGKPSSRMRKFEQSQGFFQIDYPENWRPYPGGYGVTIVPEGGVVNTGNNQQSIVYGAIINHYVPFEGSVGNDRNRRRETSLEDATDDLVRQLAETNSHLRSVNGSKRKQRIDGQNALSLLLAGRSPVTGNEERVTVFTRELEDEHVLFALFIAPGQDSEELGKTFQKMIASLQVNDRSAHR